MCISCGSFLSEQCGFCVSGPKDSFLNDALTGFCAAAYAMVFRAFLLFVVVELGLVAVFHAGACLRQADLKNKSACLGGTFCLHAGCHSFCDKDSRDGSTARAQEKAMNVGSFQTAADITYPLGTLVWLEPTQL